ncbi:Uncharacterised protein [Mycobacterium tuberculosis]|nr:Uncharacterised protein [Mycobacterium tuberculosis]
MFHFIFIIDFDFFLNDFWFLYVRHWIMFNDSPFCRSGENIFKNTVYIMNRFGGKVALLAVLSAAIFAKLSKKINDMKGLNFIKT